MIYIDETRAQKKIIIRKDEDSIIIKVKHIPIFMMMMQTHYGKFSGNCNFGKHEVIKRENGLDTIVVKKGKHEVIKRENGLDTVVVKKGKSDASSKYAIGQYDNGDRLYGLDFEDYIEVTEDETKQLMLLLADYFIALSNERGYM